ncbi:hypothetical protein [Alteromonas sp. C1M14]|uniref:hypothetical protein n=1 Tax=Alteromonas sp. C1M14 TaxID=2841567 RepID=UPI001C0873AC|nr:hypothetical protein [Alteromonas sp. C1M14]MBU2979909.1 hypothetical protein [Alteromonas sp. C1M14]
MARLSADQKIQPHWWSKTIASAVLGLTLAFAIIGLFAWYGPGGINGANKNQFNMWMISPIWLAIISFSFLFRTGTRAFLFLGGANVICWGLFVLLRYVL